MFRARLVAVFIVVLLALGHVAAYQYFAEQVTETMRDQATGADQARSLRLHLQLFMLLDTALLVFLIGWVTVWNERRRHDARLRSDYADLRKALELERKLAEADQRLNLMIETTGAGFLLVSENEKVILANRRAATLLKIDRNRLDRVFLSNLLAPQASVRFGDLRRLLQDRNVQNISLPLQRFDGQVVNAQVQLTLFEGPKGEELISFLLVSIRSPEESAREGAQKKGGAILVVDDEEIIRLVAKGMLETLGYKPLPAAGAHEAEELLEQHREQISAAVVDLVMPDVDGRELAGRLREMKPGMPILFCSGFADKTAELTLSDGESVLPKPFDFNEFKKAIEDLLG